MRKICSLLVLGLLLASCGPEYGEVRKIEHYLPNGKVDIYYVEIHDIYESSGDALSFIDLYGNDVSIQGTYKMTVVKEFDFVRMNKNISYEEAEKMYKKAAEEDMKSNNIK